MWTDCFNSLLNAIFLDSSKNNSPSNMKIDESLQRVLAEWWNVDFCFSEWAFRLKNKTDVSNTVIQILRSCCCYLPLFLFCLLIIFFPHFTFLLFIFFCWIAVFFFIFIYLLLRKYVVWARHSSPSWKVSCYWQFLPFPRLLRELVHKMLWSLLVVELSILCAVKQSFSVLIPCMCQCIPIRDSWSRWQALILYTARAFRCKYVEDDWIIVTDHNASCKLKIFAWMFFFPNC